MTKIVTYLSLCVGLLITACASHVESDVTRFNALDNITDKSIHVVPFKAEHVDGLEYGIYEAFIKSALSKQGFTVGDDAAALTARVDFERSAARITMVPLVQPYPFWDPYYYGGGYHWRYYSPLYHSSVWGHGTSMIRRKVYDHTLRIMIDDHDGTRLFEGTVVSETRDNSLASVMPYLVEAMFVDFPGQSGETKKIVLKKEHGAPSNPINE